VKFGDGKAVATDSFTLIEVNGVKGEGVFKAKPLAGMKVRDLLTVGKGTLKIENEDGREYEYKAEKEPRFPLYEGIFPREFVKQISVNAYYLAAALEAIGSLDEHSRVVLKIPAQDLKPIVLEVEGKARAMVMPMLK
jgi:hypothetical protein